jgi:hypothetical protein
MAGAGITGGIPLALGLRQDVGRLERLLVNGWHLGKVIKLGRDFSYGWRQSNAVKDGKDEEEALAEGDLTQHISCAGASRGLDNKKTPPPREQWGSCYGLAWG